MVAGTPAVAVASLEALRTEHHVVAVLTQPDAPAGRGRRLIASDLARRADELGIRVLKPSKVIEAIDELSGLAPEAVAVIAYGQLVPQRVLAADGPLGDVAWVNLHFSVLPRWRGAAPVQRAIMAGDQELGVTCFRLVSELDAGPVYRCRSWPLPSDETAGEALERLAHAGTDVLLEALDAVAAGEQPVAQSGEVTFAPKITVEDARLNFARPATELVRQVLGCNPSPGAWTTFRSERFKVLRAHVTDSLLEPGELQPRKRELLVGTGTMALALDEVQAFGKKAMTGPDWARGVNFVDGDRLETPDE